jgi:hypothetical protein
LILRDILYFDFEKAASLISQLKDGLLKEKSESSESSKDQRNIRKYDLLKVMDTEFGGIQSEKKAILETKVLHHDLLVRLEEFLTEEGFASDINNLSSDIKISEVSDIHNAISETPYIKAEGWCAFEDFETLYEATQYFNRLLSFIKRSEFSAKYQIDTLKATLDEMESTASKKSPKLKEARAEFKATERKIEEEIGRSLLDEKLFEGIREWIDAFIRGRLNLRVCPFENIPDFEVIANLKRECFVDDNLTHLMYGYGSTPNVKLCVLGLTTSVPPKDNELKFDFYRDTIDHDEDSEVETIERAFRRIFPALHGMEKFTTFHRYPRVIIHPIAVYRHVQPGHNN